MAAGQDLQVHMVFVLLKIVQCDHFSDIGKVKVFPLLLTQLLKSLRMIDSIVSLIPYWRY